MKRDVRKKAKIFVLEDDSFVLSMLLDTLEKEGYEVMSGDPARCMSDHIYAWSPDMVMLDINLPGRSGLDVLSDLKERSPDLPVIMFTADDTAETAVKAMKIGADDYLTKPFSKEEMLIVIGKILESAKLRHEVDYLRKVCLDTFKKDIIGESDFLRDLRLKIEKFADAGVSTVLITGESGTGKELMARFIHSMIYPDCTSNCAPFVAVNCTALPEALLESELFGYEKGAFTDAKTGKKGLFELAAGGSILLDEIGDMKVNLQSRLLRVLEERKMRRLGGEEELSVDVTVIATTNTDLSMAVENGEFRKDLFYRLNTFSLNIIPLRDRKDDILPLARHFLEHFSTEYKRNGSKRFSPEAEELLRSHDWPGNVRELKNVVERIVVLESVEVVTADHLPADIRGRINGGNGSLYRYLLPDTGISLDDVERDFIMQAFEKTGRNKSLAAKLLNISYDSIRYHVKKFGLE